MKCFEYIIRDELGIHARPAGQLVKAASAYQCAVKLEAKGKTADAKRIMGVMQMAAKCGDTLTVTCEGADEADAAAALERFLGEHL